MIMRGSAFGYFVLGVLATLLLSACIESRTRPEESADGMRHEVVLAINCLASVDQLSLSCERSPSSIKLPPNLQIVGGEGVNVQLISSNVSHDPSTGVFRADVMVQNLMDEALGTADGTSTTGVRVLFHTGPSAVAGTGTVKVRNSDGTATFAGSSQPYHEYMEILSPGETSAVKTWEWDVSPTVETFVFGVLVEGDVPVSDYALRFYGNGVNDIDRVKIRIDTPETVEPGPPVDVGATNFTIEFWMRGLAAENGAAPVECGASANWMYGNIIVDRDRYGFGRKYGISMAGGRIVFGVGAEGDVNLTICGTSRVDDGVWHHIALTRARSTGALQLFVDGVREAGLAMGPPGDISYPDDGVPGNSCGGPCTDSDPFLVIGAEKHDADPTAFPSFSGNVDEIRYSNVIRYAADFAPPGTRFVPDINTVALYHFDEGTGDVITDLSGAVGGPSDGVRKFGGDPIGPRWVISDAPISGGAPFVPQESDWVEQGVALTVGPPGAWDSVFAGASTPSSVVKQNGAYFLYYGAADGTRSTDGGPRHRAIGVAVSSDGVNFTKYVGNPVMTHLPNGGEEEGANSAAVALDEDGSFVMFYGAATEVDAGNINSDGRVAKSLDGFEFSDQGVALDHTDPSLYGFGDEIFPLAAYRYRGNWYVFYVVGGGENQRDLAVAWGPAPDQLDSSALVVDGDATNPARMGGNISWLSPDQIVVFIQRGWFPDIRIEVRTAHPATPYRLSRPLAVYDGPMWRGETKQLTAFLDPQQQTWFLYRSNWNDEYILHRAPQVTADSSSQGSL